MNLYNNLKSIILVLGKSHAITAATGVVAHNIASVWWKTLAIAAAANYIFFVK